jgi:DNA-binding transcriptional MocR family regulator
VAAKPKFTRIPKVSDLVLQGVPTEAIPTYCALADHANNKTGLCWPKMETLAETLNRSVRTIQRHLHLLQNCGMIEFVERRRWKGRFSSYTYKILHIVTTGHGRRMDNRRSNKRRTKQSLNNPQTPNQTPKKDVKDGYWWLFGEEAPAGAQEEWTKQEKERRAEEAQRRVEGYEWFFT